MRVGILKVPGGLDAYVGEILRAWGLRNLTLAATPPADPSHLPVLIVPAELASARPRRGDADPSPPPEGRRGGLPLEPLRAYVERGGTLILIQPGDELAGLGGLTAGDHLGMPRRLRFSTLLPAGFDGEAPPIVGSARAYRAAESVQTLAHLFAVEDCSGDLPGITVTSCGQGRVICFTFDLPWGVLLLRQGDPALVEKIPAGDTCWRPTHMAAETGVHDAGWVPYADLLGRLLVEFAAAWLGAPLPLLDHLPDGAPGILLYSGDEDVAPLEAINEEFDWLTQQGVRMDLNIIPEQTHSTPTDVARYRRHHDVNPHPNLRALDGRPIAERLAELERQIRLFETKFGGPVPSLRNHGTAWCGYMEHVEVLERCGVKMDTDYFSGSYKRRRDVAPYNPFGGAMPLRFCRPDGRLLEVYQQHTPLADDVYFAPEEGRYRATTYSYRLSPAVFERMLERIYRDIVERFHTPLGVCIHPGNWVAFSRPHGQALVREAQRFGLPAWSFTQWCGFWARRDGWQFDELTWNDGRLSFVARGGEPDAALRVALPGEFQGAKVRSVRIDGKVVESRPVRRYRQDVALAPLSEKPEQMIEVIYT